MKKLYLKPVMEVEEVEMQTIIAASNLTYGGTSNDNDVFETQSKDRGIWGDIWYEE